MKNGIISIFLLLSVFSTFNCKQHSTSSTTPKPKWMAFSKNNIHGILDDNIHAIHLSGNGQVWFGSDMGTFYYELGSWRSLPPDTFLYYTYFYGTPVPHRRINAIGEGIDGSLWFGLDGGGIRRYNRNSIKNVWQRYTTSNNIITGIDADVDKPGDIWIATADGIYTYSFIDLNEPTIGTFQRLGQPLPSPIVNGVMVNQKNKWIFFGTNSGMFFYNATFKSWNSLLFTSQSPIQSIAVQFTSNFVWCGTEINVGFYDAEKSILREYTPANTNGKLPNSVVYAVMTDYFYTTRWFGTDTGLVQMKDSTWSMITKENTPELPSNRIQALYYDYLRKNLWIGTNQGIAVYNENGVKL